MSYRPVSAMKKRISACTNTLLRLQPRWALFLLHAVKWDYSEAYPFPIATDGATMYVNYRILATFPDPEIVFLLAHEVLHCIAGHCLRRGGRDKTLWNEAADYVVNLLLDDLDRKHPNHLIKRSPRLLFDRRYQNLSVEAVYAHLAKDADPSGKPQDSATGQGAGAGTSPQRPPSSGSSSPPHTPAQPSPSTPSQPSPAGPTPSSTAPATQPQTAVPGKPTPGSGAPTGSSASTRPSKADVGWVLDHPEPAKGQEQLQDALQQIRIQSSMAGIGAHGDDYMERAFDRTMVKINWEQQLMVLCHSVAARKGHGGFSWRRPNPYFMYQHRLCLPTLSRTEPLHIRVGVDTSGSISDDQLARIAASLTRLSQTFTTSRITVLHCDTAIRHEQHFQGGIPIDLEPKGGGGTNFTPVFEYPHPCDLLIYCTDLIATIPPKPRFPVLWGYIGDDELPFQTPSYGKLVRIDPLQP